MSKFSRSDDPGFVAICGELRRWIRDVGAPTTAEVSQLLPGPPAMHGEGSRQYVTHGGTQNIVGGNYFEARGTQNFGTVPDFR